MKKTFILLTCLFASTFFIACDNNKTIRVSSVPTSTRSAPKPVRTTSGGTTTTVMPPSEMIIKEEYLDARVIFLNNDDLEAAIVLAKAEKKPIFIDFYADWCAPCKVLDDGVFHDYDIADFMNKNVINLKVNIEKGNGSALKQSMYVSALPTLLFLDSEGNEIGRRENLPLIADFKKMMKAAVWKVKNPSGQP